MSTLGGPAQRVLVAIPAFNEEASVGGVIREIRSLLPDVDVLVADDGSQDGTVDQARLAGALVCELPFNLGVGGAMRAAYKFARAAGYDVVVQVDADGQHDPRYIPTLIAGLEQADVVVGARFAGLGDYRCALVRRTAMRVLALVLSRQAGGRLTDVTSGFRAANKRAINLFSAHYPSEYLGDTVESLVIAMRTGCRVTQVPVVMKPRAFGRSSQSTLRAIAYLARATGALSMALVRTWPVSANPMTVEKAELEDVLCAPT